MNLLANAINALCEDCHATAVDKGWYDTELKPPELIALCHSELSEALECYRDDDDLGLGYREGEKPDGFVVELADTLIRIFDMAAFLKLDLGAALIEKMRYNTTRPYRHGNKRA